MTSACNDTILIDTNLILDDENIIFKLSKQYQKILIPTTVLKELDRHKYDPNLSYSARNAIRSIKEFKEKYPDKIIFSFLETEFNTNDENIIRCAKEYNAVIATKDISMATIAEGQGIQTTVFDVVLNNIFNPYFFVEDSTLLKDFTWQQMYQSKREYQRIFSLFSEFFENKLIDYSWFFIFIKDKEKYLVYAHNPIKFQFIRIDNIPQYLELNIEGNKIKALDMYQNCALYALNEAPHCLLTGKWGSGKTLLVTANAISNFRKKIFITRPPVGINHRYDVGFFPGTKEDKMMEWLSGFSSSLYYIFGNTNGQVNLKKKSSYDYVRDVVFHNYFEILPLNSIQGLSLLDDDLLLVDEVQLLSVDYMSMLLSRPSGSGKLVLMGDLSQTYNVVKPSESGLLKLFRALPHRHLAFVELKNSYRSELIELATRLQDKSF